jgi:hypothetical protein
MSNPWRQLAFRLAEVAGVVVVAYIMGGILTTLRLDTGGIPFGSDAISLIPSEQLLVTGARALLGAVIFPIGLVALFSLGDVVGSAGRSAIARWRNVRVRRTVAQLQETVAMSVVFGVLIGAGVVSHSLKASAGGPYTGAATFLLPSGWPSPALPRAFRAFA